MRFHNPNDAIIKELVELKKQFQSGRDPSRCHSNLTKNPEMSVFKSKRHDVCVLRQMAEWLKQYASHYFP